MRDLRPLSTFYVMLFVVPFQGLCGAEPCFLPSWSRPVVSTTYVVERPTVVSESIPIRIGPPIRETILSYETPPVLSTSSFFMTIDYAKPDLVPLQPAPVVSPVDTSHLVVDPGSARDSHLADDHRSPQDSDRTVVRRPPLEEVTTPNEKALEPLSEPPKRDTSPRLSIPPPIPTILGQSGSSFNSELEEALAQPPPLPQGPVDPTVIPSKLVDRREEAHGVFPPHLSDGEFRESNSGKAALPRRKTSEERYSLGESSINGILLITTIISVMTLIYMILIAIDYHQRWMQSLTSQNSVFASSWAGDGYGGVENFDLYENTSCDGEGLDDPTCHRSYGDDI